MKEQHELVLQEINARLESETQQKELYYTDLQRRKGETNNLYEGGFGTFTLAFENPFYNQLLEKQAQLHQHRLNTDMLKASLKGKKKKQRATMIK